MSENSNATGGEPLASQSNASASTPAAEYKVGPGRPPPDKRWKKGGPSPNPRGRPRKDQSMLPDLRKAFERALNKKVAVSGGGRKVLMTRLEIGFEQLFTQFAKGDRYARRDFMEYADKLDIDFLAKHKKSLEEVLTPNYQTIIDAYLARQSGAANVTLAPHVLAPPELLDDDSAENDSAEPEPTPPSPPLAKTEPQPMPEPSRKEKQAVQKLDQASRGRGNPPPGGFSLTTGKWT